MKDRAGRRTTSPGSSHDGDADRIAAERGVHRIALPTPAVAGANCWLIADDPLTLVDCGVDSGAALDALEREVRRLGFRLEQVGLVVLTHQHVDHVGLAEVVVGRSGADVACHALLADWLAGLPAVLEADDAWIARRLEAHGAPRHVVCAYEARMEMMRLLGSRPTPTVVVPEGGELRLRDRVLRLTLRPGHSPTDTVLADRAHDLQLTGDHLMPGAWTTPYLDPRPSADWRADLAPALELRASLRRTAAEAPAGLGLPGHGAAFLDVGAAARSVLARQRRRALRLLEQLDERPATPWELAQRVYPQLTPSRAFLGFLEVLARLAVLHEEGLAEAHPDGRACRFTRAGG